MRGRDIAFIFPNNEIRSVQARYLNREPSPGAALQPRCAGHTAGMSQNGGDGRSLSQDYGPFMRRLAPGPQHKSVQLTHNTSPNNMGKRREGSAARTKTSLHVARESLVPSEPASRHAESLPNTSVVVSVSALADADDVLAAARTAMLLARSSGTSLNVTVLEETLLDVTHELPTPHGAVERLMSSIRTKLLGRRAGGHRAHFALEASITAASFLKSGSISLHVRAVDSQSPFITR